MFLNTFSYGYTSIKNPHNFHINISKEINTLSTKDIIQTKRVGGADIALDYQHKIVQEYVRTPECEKKSVKNNPSMIEYK